MRQPRAGRRSLRSTCFCDPCARVVRCDTAAQLDEARRQSVLRLVQLVPR